MLRPPARPRPGRPNHPVVLVGLILVLTPMRRYWSFRSLEGGFPMVHLEVVRANTAERHAGLIRLTPAPDS
jgi:hypothetical protein